MEKGSPKWNLSRRAFAKQYAEYIVSVVRCNYNRWMVRWDWIDFGDVLLLLYSSYIRIALGSGNTAKTVKVNEYS